MSAFRSHLSRDVALIRSGVMTLLILLSIITAAIPAFAIDVDRGWTQYYNYNYPVDSGNPECRPDGSARYCYAWDQYRTLTYDYGYNVASATPNGGYWTEVGAEEWRYISPRSPVTVLSYGSGGGANIWIDRFVPISPCAQTNFFYVARPPINDVNPHQQRTVTHVDIQLSPSCAYNESGNYTGNNIDIQYGVGHETGHAMDLGHTANSAQLMFGYYRQNWSPSYNFYPASGDLHGVQCSYDLTNCFANP